MNKTPTTLIIMDGFGIAPPADDNAVTLAKTPVLDRLFQEYAHTTLSASGLDVGLPAGQMGNSEVGHTNIGGGRVVFQDLPRISRAIEDGSFFRNEAYNKAMDDCLKNGTALHLYGLLSNGGVHSHIDHLYALMRMAKDKGLQRVYLHCFLDGRDVSPTSGKGFVQALAESARSWAWARSPRSWAGTTPWTGTAAGSGWSGPTPPWCMPTPPLRTIPPLRFPAS